MEGQGQLLNFLIFPIDFGCFFESSDFFDVRNGLVFEFRAKLGKTGFFGKTTKINRKNEKI